jgi:hypothetical protein
MDKDNHAESNAKASYENIVELVTALECDYDRLEELRDERKDLDDALEELRKEWDAEEDQQAKVEIFGKIKEGDEELSDWDAENGEELKELAEAATLDGELVDAETARERIQERPLSVQVRSGWVTPAARWRPRSSRSCSRQAGRRCASSASSTSTRSPHRAWLEYQDWGTPWTRYFPTEQETLLSFCRCFYFGG